MKRFPKLASVRILAMLVAAALTVMSAGEVTDYINGFVEKGATPETLYNLGFQLYYRHGFPQKEIAASLSEGYRGAKGNTTEQQKAIDQAAVFWARELAYWNKSIIGPQNLPGTLPLFSPPRIGGRDQDIIPMTPAPRYPYRR